MAAAVITVAKPTNVRGYVSGNKRVTYRDITADTGDYAAGGFTVTAAQLGLKHIDHVSFSGMATDGTAGATAEGLGVTYASSGASIAVQIYQTGTSADAPLNEKGAEAYAANFAVRIRAEGW